MDGVGAVVDWETKPGGSNTAKNRQGSSKAKSFNERRIRSLSDVRAWLSPKGPNVFTSYSITRHV